LKEWCVQCAARWTTVHDHRLIAVSRPDQWSFRSARGIEHRRRHIRPATCAAPYSVMRLCIIKKKPRESKQSCISTEARQQFSERSRRVVIAVCLPWQSLRVAAQSCEERVTTSFQAITLGQTPQKKTRNIMIAVVESAQAHWDAQTTERPPTRSPRPFMFFPSTTVHDCHCLAKLAFLSSCRSKG